MKRFGHFYFVGSTDVRRRHRGLSLAELLVSVGIILLMLSLLIPAVVILVREVHALFPSHH